MLGIVACSEKKESNLTYFSILLCTFVAMKESTTLLDGDITIYARLFYYSRLEENDKRFTDGVQFPIFAHRHHDSIKEFLPALSRVVEDKELEKKITCIKDSLGINLDVLNLYMLGAYINEMIRELYLILLKKPTKESLEALSEVEEVTFKNKEGETVTTNYQELIKVCIDSAKSYLNSEGDILETAKMGRYDKVGSLVDKNIFQSQFAYYIAIFLRETFPNANRKHRGKKSIVSPLEQELIIRLMGYFDLGLKTDSTATENIRKKLRAFENSNYPFDSSVLYIKYEDWQRKIDWKDPKLKLYSLSKEEEDCVFYNPNTLIKD